MQSSFVIQDEYDWQAKGHAPLNGRLLDTQGEELISRRSLLTRNDADWLPRRRPAPIGRTSGADEVDLEISQSTVLGQAGGRNGVGGGGRAGSGGAEGTVEPPEFTAVLRPAVAPLGGSVRLSCAAMGRPDPRLTWYHGGTALVNGGRYSIDVRAALCSTIYALCFTLSMLYALRYMFYSLCCMLYALHALCFTFYAL